MAGRYRNVCFTLNNPEDMVMYDGEQMSYLVYQEEIGDSGTYHFQGYAEFAKQMSLAQVKGLLGGATVHVERRRGSQEQAIAYCKDEKKRLEHTDPYEYGEPRTQGKRTDLEGFKGAVMGGAKLRELIDDHWGVIARYPKFYSTLTLLNRPVRGDKELQVTLLFGETGLGKTRSVEEKFEGNDDFWRTPLSNGTTWFDSYDGHSAVLLDDFSGAASHFTLCNLLQLLDRYPVQVPNKGGHTWWLPDEVFITTNILPRYWYKWENRGEQYKALARRFTEVRLYYVSLPGTHSSFTIADSTWWEQNKPEEALY